MELAILQNSYFDIPALNKNTPHSTVSPYINGSSAIFTVFKFHITYARHVVLKEAKLKESTRRVRLLLQHPKRCSALQTEQNTGTILKVLQNIDLEFGIVTSMMLRYSFATMMFDKYRQRKIMKDRSENEFLEKNCNLHEFFSRTVKSHIYLCLWEFL